MFYATSSAWESNSSKSLPVVKTSIAHCGLCVWCIIININLTVFTLEQSGSTFQLLAKSKTNLIEFIMLLFLKKCVNV